MPRRKGEAFIDQIVDPERTLAYAKRLGNSGKIYSKLKCPLICSLDI